MTSVEFIAPLAAVFVLVTAATGAALMLVGERACLSRAARALPSSLHAAVVFAPAVAGALGCLALAFPNPLNAGYCAAHGPDDPHLCAYHPAFVLALLAPSACIVGAWLSLAAPRLLGLLREVIASKGLIRAARRVPEHRLDDVVFRLVDGASRSAVTVGVWSPVILFDRLLWDALSGEERRAVLHHERAHAERRDGLTLLLLRLAAALCPVPLGSRFVARWRLSAERPCDRHAATAVGDAGAVAAALVAVERARCGDPSAPVPKSDTAFGVANGGDLETRVMALLEEPERAHGSSLGNDAFVVGLVALVACLLTAWWPGDLFHHAAEELLFALVSRG